MNIENILKKHYEWLASGGLSGERADLSGADLRRANLYRANLSGADLRWANLRWANLYGASLYGADLHGADLSVADLRGANLYGADLHGANLSGVDLRGADLNGANLYGADLRGTTISYPIACPEKGSFIGFKKAGMFIVELLITEDALRSSATSRKCRCSKAKVSSITNLDGSATDIDAVFSDYDETFRYEVGKTVEVPNFDTNRWNECAPGIHFFITRQEAVEY